MKKNMVTHDTECPCWDQVLINDTKLKLSIQRKPTAEKNWTFYLCLLLVNCNVLSWIVMHCYHFPGMLDHEHLLSSVRGGTYSQRGGAEEDDQLLPVGGANTGMSGGAVLYTQAYMEAVQQKIRWDSLSCSIYPGLYEGCLAKVRRHVCVYPDLYGGCLAKVRRDSLSCCVYPDLYGGCLAKVRRQSKLLCIPRPIWRLFNKKSGETVWAVVYTQTYMEAVQQKVRWDSLNCSMYFWFKYDIGQKYRPNWALNSWTPWKSEQDEFWQSQ